MKIKGDSLTLNSSLTKSSEEVMMRDRNTINSIDGNHTLNTTFENLPVSSNDLR